MAALDGIKNSCYGEMGGVGYATTISQGKNPLGAVAPGALPKEWYVMHFDEWPVELQTTWKEFEASVIEYGRMLLHQVPATMKAQVTTFEEIEAVTRQMTQTLAQEGTHETVQALEPTTPPTCPTCATAMRQVDVRALTKLGIFGIYHWHRAYYVCPAGHGAWPRRTSSWGSGRNGSPRPWLRRSRRLPCISPLIRFLRS